RARHPRKAHYAIDGADPRHAGAIPRAHRRRSRALGAGDRGGEYQDQLANGEMANSQWWGSSPFAIRYSLLARDQFGARLCTYAPERLEYLCSISSFCAGTCLRTSALFEASAHRYFL